MTQMWCPIYWRRNLLRLPAHSTVQKRDVVGRQGTEQKTVERKWVNAIANDSEKASWSETDDMGWDKLKDFSTLCKGAVKKKVRLKQSVEFTQTSVAS